MAEKKKLAVIDGKSVFYRGYYAMPNLSNSDGIPTGGVYGFATMALELVKKLKPDYVAVAWDKPKTNIRRRLEIYPEYKAGRKAAPPDFYTQIPILHQLLEAFGWPLYELDDYEADDIMGTLAVEAEKRGIEVLLITSDLDMLQLVNHGVKVYALKRGFSNIEEYHPESFEAKYGLKPNQFLDLKSLKGDSSDNIPGVPGVGEKTAIELLKEFKTLDGVYNNLDQIKESTRKKLEAGKELAYLSKKIGAIWCDAPLKFDSKAMDGRHIDTAALRVLLDKLEFRTLLRNLPDNMQAPSVATKLDGLKAIPLIEVKEPKQLEDFATKGVYFAHAHYANSSRTELGYLALANDQGDGLVVSGEQMQDLKYQRALAKSMATVYDNHLVSFDLKSLIKLYQRWSVAYHDSESLRALFDVQIAAFLLNSIERGQSLEDLTSRYLNIHLAAENESEFEQLGVEIAAIQKLHEKFYNELRKSENKRLQEVFYDIEMPVIPVLAKMEVVGIELDQKYMQKLDAELTKSIDDLQKKIYKAAGHEFNIGSPAQLSEVLFVKLQLSTAGIKKTQSTYSTAASELAKLAGTHPIIELIGQYREVTKLKNTYVDALPKLADENSRLHTTFNMTVAPTGRLSSNDPNLQNIPVKTDLGRQIRTAFVAGKGNQLVSIDYSQQELRLAAALSGDENMIKAFNQDADIHTETAAEIYGIPADKVTKSQRSSVKEVNFGILYGLGPHALSQSTGMSFAESRDFIKKYFEIRPKLKEYIERTRQQADQQGYVETLLGRRRPTPDVHSSNFVVREAAYRAAVNMPLQGSAADITKLAMIEVDKALDDDCKLLLQVHDSILIECPASKAEAVGKQAKKIMENVYTKLPIKLKADVSIGKNWGEL